MLDSDLTWRTEEDERSRRDALKRIEEWARVATQGHEGVSVVVYGSVVRGDYAVGSDMDILVVSPQQEVAHAIAVGARVTLGRRPESC